MADQRVIAGRLTALYGPVTRRAPFLWAAAYHATNFKPTVRLFQHAVGRGLRRKLRGALEPQPALVASFHPLLNHVAVDVMPYGVPRVTVITDWINFHQAWTDLTADCIICPSDAAVELCRRRGVPADRLVKAGLPIHPRFQDAIRGFTDKTAMRLKLRLRPHAPTVLLAGGGDGTEPLRKYAAALARSPLDIQVLAICGRNRALAERIREDNHAGVRPARHAGRPGDDRGRAGLRLPAAADGLPTRPGRGQRQGGGRPRPGPLRAAAGRPGGGGDRVVYEAADGTVRGRTEGARCRRPRCRLSDRGHHCSAERLSRP